MNSYQQKRFKGAILGLAVGDALGAPLEFKSPGSFIPLNDMTEGGFLQLKPGQWTDDTSMALCLAESFIEKKEFNPTDQLERYCNWWENGHLSSKNRCFDIGNTTRGSLAHFKATKNEFSGDTNERSAGNGSIMRLAPVPLFYFKNPEKAIVMSGESSRTTHAALECIDACRYLGGIIAGAVNGATKERLLSSHYSPTENKDYWKENPLAPRIDEIANGSFKRKSPPEIKGTGYVVESLEAALWAFHNSESFEDCVLKAVNLGDDADTTGAVAGQVAGAFYGDFEDERGIPEKWVNKLAKLDLIKNYAQKLFEAANSQV